MPAHLQIAIIGCGSMGEIHAQCLSRIEHVTMRAFCDADEQRAQSLCAKFQGVYATTDPEKVLRDDTVDAVYICTHHDTHSALAIRAAEQHKHVMVEKPLALTLEECYEVGNAVEKHGITLMTGFKMRYYPSVARVREFIPSPLVTIGPDDGCTMARRLLGQRSAERRGERPLAGMPHDGPGLPPQRSETGPDIC